MAKPTPLFKITAIPNSGLGAVATAPITRGTLIISEPALFFLSADFRTPAAANAGIAAKLCTLTPTQMQTFTSLTNVHAADGSDSSPFAGIVRTNALPCGVNAVECGVFPTCSRFNHSCNPNANYCWNPKTRQEMIHAVKDIAVGEQICVSYLDEESTNYSRAQRQERLRRDFCFECTCGVCSGGAVAASDARRREVVRLDELVGGGVLMMGQPGKALGYCRKILELLAEEGIQDVSLYRTYYDAFQICVTHGDMARASAMASLGVKVKVDCHGVDAVDEELLLYVKSPERHRLAGMTRRWATKVGDAKEAGSEGFEQWLWVRAR